MKKIPKKYVKVFCNKVEFQFNSKPMTLFPLPALPHYFFRPDMPSIIESTFIVILCIWIFVGNIVTFCLDITQE